MNNKRIIITLWQARGGPQYLETFRAGADPGIILSALLAQLVDRLGSDGFWEGDYGWGVRVSRPFGARWRSSVRVTLKINTQHTQGSHTSSRDTSVM